MGCSVPAALSSTEIKVLDPGPSDSVVWRIIEDWVYLFFFSFFFKFCVIYERIFSNMPSYLLKFTLKQGVSNIRLTGQKQPARGFIATHLVNVESDIYIVAV